MQIPSDKGFVVYLFTAETHELLDTYTSVPGSYVENGIVRWNTRLTLQTDTFYLPASVSYNNWSTLATRYVASERGLASPQALEAFLRERLDEPALTVTASAGRQLLADIETVSAGSFFRPTYRLQFGINPLNRESVFIGGSLKTGTLLKEIYWMLAASAVWAVLLILCLIYQARTIHGERKLNRLRNDFLHAMIHELKRPVQSLKILMSVLKDKEMSHDETLRREAVADAQAELDNLSAYFSKLRDMTYGDFKEIPLNRTVFSLNALLRPLAEKAERQGVSIRIDSEPQDILVKADRMHISNIFSNLLENAVKYARGEAVITITLRQTGNRTDIKVSDNGRGIPADELKHIFEKFYRSPAVRRENIPGLGLGLSYVKSLVEAHRGHIRVESEPKPRYHLLYIYTAMNDSPLKILFADDDATYSLFLKRFLKKAGYEVVHVPRREAGAGAVPPLPPRPGIAGHQYAGDKRIRGGTANPQLGQESAAVLPVRPHRNLRPPERIQPERERLHPQALLSRRTIGKDRRTFRGQYRRRQPALPASHTLFSPETNELTVCGTAHTVTSRQAEILTLLFQNINQTVYREDILTHVWGNDSYANSLALNVQISYLRHYLKDDSGIRIESIKKKGYVLRTVSPE